MSNLSAVELLFFTALEKPSAEDRAAYLDEACGRDPELRRCVERLLAAYPKAGSFLHAPPPHEAPTVDEPPLAERPGTIIGPYKLMEKIGEGGMGLVFVAEQQHPVNRKVALKIIKPGMDTREVIARFEAERQALALMDHPHIARILDADTTESGRPYFVMELVKGIPITDFCDQNQLTPRERLGLFVGVCQAVQHAHGKGVIHRDLKPSNVLVTLHDGTPVAKVIDFGVAKAVGRRLTDRTVYTGFLQMVGTPLYMSPEQAAMGGLDIDTRCDVYALGVLLYELLTGTTPFDSQRLQKAAFDEVRRIIREEEPPKPSTRLTALGATLSAVSGKRKMEPNKLSALVKGDLDWIVMKALEKDRNRRYETASAFAADVRRFLNEEPIEARPPSAWYRFTKTARRHRAALATAAVVAAALVVGTVVSTWQAVAALNAEARARLIADDLQVKKAEADKNALLANQRQQQVAAVAKGLNLALYEADLELMPAAWEADDLATFDQLLQREIPGPDVGDVRGFEWHYWNRQRHGERRSIPLAGGFHDMQHPVFSSDGKHFAAVTRVDGRGEVRIWDTATGQVQRTLLTIPDYRQPLAIVPPRLLFSPDGRRVALSLRMFQKPKSSRPEESAMSQLLFGLGDTVRQEIRVWEVDNGRQLLDLTVDRAASIHDGLAFDPEGKRLAFGAPPPPGQPPTGNIHLCDVDAGKEAFTLLVPGQPRELAFSPDGIRLAVALSREGFGERFPDDKNRIQIWDVVNQKVVCMIHHKGWIPQGIELSPDGTRLAAVWKGDGEDILSLYDAGTGKELSTMQRPVTLKGAHWLTPVFSGNGRRLTAPSAGSVVPVWDAATGALLFTARGHAGTPGVAFNDDGTRLFTAGWEGTVKEWSEPPPHPEPKGLEANSNFSPLASALTRTGLRLARAFSAGAEDASSLEIRGWDEAKGPFTFTLPTGPRASKVQHLLFDAEGARLAADYVIPAASPKDVRTELKVWDAGSGKELFTAAGTSIITGLALSPDGTRVAWAGDQRVRVWDVGTGRELLNVEEPWDFIFFPAFSPDGARLAWAGDRRLRVWDLAAAREVMAVSDAGGQVGRLVFNAGGSRLAGSVGLLPGASSEVKMWDVADGREVLTLKGQKQVWDLAFSPDGSRLASVRGLDRKDGKGSEVTLWDALTGLPLLRLRTAQERGSEVRLQFQPDGARLFLFNLEPSRSQEAYEVWDATPLPDTRR
jgi:serine/threonine protein kinase/WD40 repeat protein